MPTIVRENGFEIQIYTRDHLPPHVHVIKAGNEARFALENGTVTLLSELGMKNSEVTKAADLVKKHYTELHKELGKMSWVKSGLKQSRTKQSAKRRKKGRK